MLPPAVVEGEEPRPPVRYSWIVWFKDGNGTCDESTMGTWALEGAQGGNAVAQFLQARRSKTTAEKVRWLRASAASGLTRAANELGMHLIETAGRNKSAITEGEALLQLAASKGEPDALYNLGLQAINRRDIPAAVSLFEQAANAGSSHAAFNMGVAAYNGRGMGKSLAAASAWFERAGTARAAYMVATIAGMGTEGAPADPVKADAWMRRAANGGDGDACMHFARKSLEALQQAQQFEGAEVEHDAAGGAQAAGYAGSEASSAAGQAASASVARKEAVRWLRCAARAGNKEADRMLRDLTSGA